MKKILLILLSAGLIASQYAQAANSSLKEENFYFGAGINNNDPNTSALDKSVGFQIFGGYEIDLRNAPVDLAVEIGYMDMGDFDYKSPATGSEEANGLWATAVFKLPVNDQVHFLGRAGLDFGDDDGLMIGVGVGFKVNREIELRGEYVDRDDTDSMQLNFIYNL